MSDEQHEVDETFRQLTSDIEVPEGVEAEATESEDQAECPNHWNFDHQALARATDFVAQAMTAAACCDDREEGADCDHVAKGDVCPFPPGDETDGIAHIANCPHCMAGSVIQEVWQFARAEMAAEVVQRLMVLRAIAQAAGDENGFAAFNAAISHVVQDLPASG